MQFLIQENNSIRRHVSVSNKLLPGIPAVRVSIITVLVTVAPQTSIYSSLSAVGPPRRATAPVSQQNIEEAYLSLAL